MGDSYSGIDPASLSLEALRQAQLAKAVQQLVSPLDAQTLVKAQAPSGATQIRQPLGAQPMIESAAGWGARAPGVLEKAQQTFAPENGTGQEKPPVLPRPKPTVRIEPYSLSPGERLRNVVANSSIGRSLESGLPRVADALSLHPSETANSPDYQKHGDQFLALDELIPENQGLGGNAMHGILSGISQATNAPNLATQAAILGTGGLAAPAAEAEGLLGIAGRAGQGALKYGLLGEGLAGLFKSGRRAVQQYNQGDKQGAAESAGEMIPNAAMMLPGLGKPTEMAGNAMEAGGVNAYNRFLKANTSRAGNNALQYDIDPGRAILEEGPGTSVALSRKGLWTNILGRLNDAGQATQQWRPTLRGVSAEPAELARQVNGPFNENTAALSGFMGAPEQIPGLEALRQTAQPLLDNPNPTMEDVYNARLNADKMINWNRDIDPVEATKNNTRRAVRSNLNQTIYGAVPGFEAPSQRYAGLAAAEQLAAQKMRDTNGSIFNPWKLAADTTSSAVTLAASHNPETALGAGLVTMALPEIAKAPIARTGGATALFQGGRALGSTGRWLNALGGRMTFPGAVVDNPANAAANGYGTPSNQPASESYGSPNNQFVQGGPFWDQVAHRFVAPIDANSGIHYIVSPNGVPPSYPQWPGITNGDIPLAGGGGVIQGRRLQLPGATVPPPNPGGGGGAAFVDIGTTEGNTGTPPNDAATPGNDTHPTPDTHEFSIKAWQAANPKGDVSAARAAAKAMGFRIVD